MYSVMLRGLCERLLTEGRAQLQMPMGIVSHIEPEEYEIVAVSSTTGVFVAGEVFPLNNTYCRDVYEQGKTIALTEMDGLPGLQRHPLYQSLPLEAYISAPIIIGGRVWGTINFSSMGIRPQPFSPDDIQRLEHAAAAIARQIQAEPLS